MHACRYCGLFEQAIAAHAEARRLDPNVPTSLEQTVLMTGDVERLLAIAPVATSVGSDSVIPVIGLGLAGRRDEARAALAMHRKAAQIEVFHAYADSLLAWLDQRPADMLKSILALEGLKIMDDPEAMFQEGWLLCDAGEHETGLGFLRRAVDKGYTVATTLRQSAAFDALRGRSAFERLLADAQTGREQALSAFREAGGETLLGR